MPNSLIFVVILAVWAAYLIQHWIRRRDHVATARSVDRFSEAMRVLERRQRMPRADLSAAAPRSYSISVTRPAHPEVMVKRAQHGSAAVAVSGSPAPAAARRVARPAARPVSRPAARSTARGSVPTGSSRSRTPLLRAVALALGVLALAAGVTVWAIGLTQWWAAVAGAGALLLALTFVRFSVGTQQRRATSPVRARAAGESHRAGRTHSGQRRPDMASARGRRGAPPADAAAAAPAHAVAHAGAVAVELYDVEAMEGASAADAAAQDGTARLAAASAVESAELLGDDVETGAELEPGTWAPVPVPPPTYTLKAKAIRAPGGAAAPVAVEDLPFDGHALALDEEFEELPSVHHVG
ncbi:hypothetical protein [Ornithinimicrobium cryptoxanthini]|uniref:Uncharacterized protein n=1 Tax=Ornithinimicrobium cryptoxanthini TaxID=2934161 RepID=A0ABY4YHK2_9MICO|nr:hypothetical protein [Ornithinimicrobium cryptoxanthini]USQ75828.1 hypothetical protein NF557_14655 [Ornithinimicrobium cryptoxanthini]